MERVTTLLLAQTPTRLRDAEGYFNSLKKKTHNQSGLRPKKGPSTFQGRPEWEEKKAPKTIYHEKKDTTAYENRRTNKQPSPQKQTEKTKKWCTNCKVTT